MHGHMSGLSFKYPYSLFHYMKDMGLADMKNSKKNVEWNAMAIDISLPSHLLYLLILPLTFHSGHYSSTGRIVV